MRNEAEADLTIPEALVPVTVMVTFPFFALSVTVAVKFEVPLPARAPGVVIIMPVFAPLVLNVTLSVNPFCGVMVAPKVVVKPRDVDTDPGETLML
jgi:hypothetical protein